MLKSDVCSILEEFWHTIRLPKGSNVAFISLIAKCENPEGLIDYRPISMVGCIYKIIAKILAIEDFKKSWISSLGHINPLSLRVGKFLTDQSFGG